MKKRILALIFSVVVMLSTPVDIVGAYYSLPLDAGNFDRYGGGGSSRRSGGGSSRRSGGSSSRRSGGSSSRRSGGGSSRRSGGSSSRRSGGSSSRRSSGGSSGGSSGNGKMGVLEFSGIIIVVGVIVVDIIIATSFRSKRKHRAKTNSYNGIMPANHNDMITAEIQKKNKAFDCKAFLSFAGYTYTELQTAWMNRDWEKIRTLEKEELFEHHKTQLDEYIRMGRINMMENIRVRNSYLHKYVRDAEFEYLTVYMDVTMRDYIIDEKTKKVLMGNKSTDVNMKYLMTFMRHKSAAADIINGVVTPLCPHCGAPVSAGSSGVCDYCNSVIHAEDYNWVLSDMEALDENTKIDNTGIIDR